MNGGQARVPTVSTNSMVPQSLSSRSNRSRGAFAAIKSNLKTSCSQQSFVRSPTMRRMPSASSMGVASHESSSAVGSGHAVGVMSALAHMRQSTGITQSRRSSKRPSAFGVLPGLETKNTAAESHSVPPPNPCAVTAACAELGGCSACGNSNGSKSTVSFSPVTDAPLAPVSTRLPGTEKDSEDIISGLQEMRRALAMLTTEVQGLKSNVRPRSKRNVLGRQHTTGAAASTVARDDAFNHHRTAETKSTPPAPPRRVARGGCSSSSDVGTGAVPRTGNEAKLVGMDESTFSC